MGQLRISDPRTVEGAVVELQRQEIKKGFPARPSTELRQGFTYPGNQANECVEGAVFIPSICPPSVSPPLFFPFLLTQSMSFLLCQGTWQHFSRVHSAGCILLIPTGKREMWRKRNADRERERGETSDRARLSVSDCGVRSGCTSQNIFKRRLFVWLSPCCQSDWHSDRRVGRMSWEWEYPVVSDTAALHALFYFSRSGVFFQARGASSWCKCWITVSVQGNSILTQIIPDGGDSARRCDSTTCWPEHA